MDQRIGMQLGNYQIIEIIATGTYGIVYRAEHIHLRRSVAIKFLHTDLNTTQQQALFLQEAQTLAELEHTNIVHLLDSGIANDTPYLVSEYASGGSLRSYLLRQPSQPLPLRNALSILADIGRALIYVHSQGIIHRDLKPENILFGKNGRVLLADFGIAQVKQATGTSRTRSVVGFGTPAYMAPEQFKAKGKPLPASDQYALGCIAYELLTGQLPFTPEDEYAYGYQHVYELPDSPRLLNPTITPRIEQAVLTALAKDPDDRHANVEAFLIALGVHQPIPTQFSLSSNSRGITSDTVVDGSNDSTLVKQPEHKFSESEAATEHSSQKYMRSDQFAPTFLRATTPVRPISDSNMGRSIPPLPQTKRTTQSSVLASPLLEESSRLLEEDSRSQTTPVWRRVQTVIATTPIFTLTKWLFLLMALIDLLLLLSGLWLGLGPLATIGIVLALGICVCGLALNFFTEPWIWSVIFLLFSPFAGAMYTLAVNIFQIDRGVINWHTCCAYLLLTPVAGFFYGMFGPNRHNTAVVAPPFAKTLTLTIWFLGAGIFIVSYAAPALVYIGLAWVLASGIMAVAQLIRLKQWDWLTAMIGVCIGGIGIPIFFLGFAYGAFGPTLEQK